MKMEIEDEKNNKENKHIPILATLDDISQINSLIISFWGKHSIYNNNFYYRVLKHNLSYGYKIDRELIAICLVEKYEREKQINIDIALLCVKKAYQRAGLGKSLLEYCIKNCESKGYDSFFLHVATTNKPAMNLYKKLGFKEIRIISNYYHLDKPPDNDAYLMVLEKGNKNNDKNKKEYNYYNNYNHYNNRNYYENYNNRHHHHNDYYNNNDNNNDYYNSYYNNNYYYNNYYNRFNVNKNYQNYYNNYGYNNYNNNNYSDYKDGYWRRYNHWNK